MIKGIWFDSFVYEGEDPASEVDSDVCNGSVFSKEELEGITHDLSNLIVEANATDINPETVSFLAEMLDKAQFGLEALED